MEEKMSTVAVILFVVVLVYTSMLIPFGSLAYGAVSKNSLAEADPTGIVDRKEAHFLLLTSEVNGTSRTTSDPVNETTTSYNITIETTSSSMTGMMTSENVSTVETTMYSNYPESTTGSTDTIGTIFPVTTPYPDVTPENYSDYLLRKAHLNSLLASLKRSPRDINILIVNGKEVKPRYSFPSIVLIRYRGGFICGGTIYNREWVLTAAHCAFNKDPSRFSFVAAEHDRTFSEGFEQTVHGVKVVKHERYNDKTLYNDIALFKVSPPFKFNDKVKPAVLAPSGWDKNSGNGTAVGWGLTKEKGESAEKLQQVGIPLMTNAECARAYGSSKITSNHICAGHPKGGVDTCQGDSGGPLYYKEGNRTIQIGITSWGYGCARPDYPGVYTRVSKYLGWVKGHAGSAGSFPGNQHPFSLF